MNLPKSTTPFRFFTQASISLITPWKARSLSELLDGLRQVPGSVIFYHTHRFLEQHHFLSPGPPNDFAYWVDTALQDRRLSERLAAIDTIRFTTIHSLREAIIRTIEDSLAQSPNASLAWPGDEFYFRQALSFVFPTPYEVWDLAEFAEVLKKVSIHSLYFHVFEARLRPPLGSNDFSTWLKSELREESLAKSIHMLDPYSQSLEGLRRQMLRLIERRKISIEEEKEWTA